MTESRLRLEDRQCSDRPLGKPGLWSQACHPAGECSGLSQPATHPFMSCLLMPPAHTGFLFNWCPKACASRQLGQALGFMGSCTDAWSGNVRPRSTQILKSSSTSWGRLDHSPSPQNWNCAPARMPSTNDSESDLMDYCLLAPYTTCGSPKPIDSVPDRQRLVSYLFRSCSTGLTLYN